MSTSSHPPPLGPPRWRNSLYARAALFLGLGAAMLIGAMYVLAQTLVHETEDRILAERIDLARTVGVLIERRVEGDLLHLSEAVRPALEGRADLGQVLAAEYRHTLFGEGAFAMDPAGRALESVPVRTADLGRALDLPLLARQARDADRAVASNLARLGAGPRPILAFLQPVASADGTLLGFVGGLLAPATHNLLESLAEGRLAPRTDLDLVDGAGNVVASTERSTLFTFGDHGDALVRAIREGRELRGMCHSCHAEPAPVRRETDVLAFAPLPTLQMGVAVHQPERDALAPAHALQRQLFLLGTSFVALFLLFAGLSVRSVVHPVTRLTTAVRALEAEPVRGRMPTFGRDEVGELAGAMERWRRRMLASLEAAEQSREALGSEIESTRRHLEALQELAAQAMLGTEAPTIMELGLDQTLGLLGLQLGTIRIRHQDRELIAYRGFDEAQARLLLDRCGERLSQSEPHASPLGFGICAHGRLDDDTCANVIPDVRLGTILGAHHVVPQGLTITTLLADPDERADVQERWLQSLVHHIGIAVTNRLLRERDLERQELQAQLLHRVLKAQEDERRRVARELHDTVAQDLSALRLEMERLSGRAVDPGVARDLRLVEDRVQDTLQAVRRTLLDLRLSVLENMGFLPTLQWHLERVERENGVRGFLSVDGEEVPLEYEMAVVLFRIFQESLQNAVLHGHAEHVMVTVAYTPEAVEMTVEDDGRGFDPDAVRHRVPDERGHGLGVLGMEERARLLGGTMEIHSKPGEGTTLTVRVPLLPTRTALGA